MICPSTSSPCRPGSTSIGSCWNALVALVVAIIVHLVLGACDRADRRGASPASRGPPVAVGPRGPPDAGIHIQDNAVAHLSALLGALFILGGSAICSRLGTCCTRPPASSSAPAIPTRRAPAPHPVPHGAGDRPWRSADLQRRARRRKLWPPLAVGVWLVALIVFLGIVPAVWQSLLVNPNQLAKEKTYIGHNIAATRFGFDLTAITRDALRPAEGPLRH